jgi:hypothetical protein
LAPGEVGDVVSPCLFPPIEESVVHDRLVVTLGVVLILMTCGSGVTNAFHLNRCGRQYSPADLYWRTNAPTVEQVLARLPAGKRTTSGNIVSLNYDINTDGSLRNKDDFRRQWSYIFGTNVSTGYGQKVRGNWAPGSQSSWGNSTMINKKNLSECVVDGSATAICLGVPSSEIIGPASLGQHTGWMILDKDSLDPTSLANIGVGNKACLTYKVMYSSNFDFSKAFESKIPGLASATDGTYPPNDHLCEEGKRTTNSGQAFSTRITFGDRLGSTTTAVAKILNHFRDDMLQVTCTRRRILNEMHRTDPAAKPLPRGVWYRVEHELVLNTNYDPRPGQLSGANSRLWIYNDKTGTLVTRFAKSDTFIFEGVEYPLMPRGDATGKINGMFVSIQQTSHDPGVRGFAIGLRDFELYLK